MHISPGLNFGRMNLSQLFIENLQFRQVRKFTLDIRTIIKRLKYICTFVLYLIQEMYIYMRNHKKSFFLSIKKNILINILKSIIILKCKEVLFQSTLEVNNRLNHNFIERRLNL